MDLGHISKEDLSQKLSLLSRIWKDELKDLIEKHISDIKQPYVPDFG